MIRSMTGYGKATCQFGSKTISVELRSLNSKQIDINARMPLKYKDREMEIRNEIVRQIQRGKVDVFMSIEDSQTESAVVINQPVVRNYFEQLRKIANDFSIPVTESLLAAVLRMPDTFKTDSALIPEEEWAVVMQTLRDAIEHFNTFRMQEGQALQADIMKRIESISDNLKQIAPFESKRVDKIKDRLYKALNELENKEGFDKNRLEQELIFYLEKLDITEEKVRLSNHCTYFYDTLKEENPGRKLGFISQEIGREINTIGSKANDSDIQKLVVVMKDELEKVKEQLLNIL